MAEPSRHCFHPLDGYWCLIKMETKFVAYIMTGTGIMFMISLQISTRRDLTDSVTELEDEVRPINPSTASQSLMRRVSGNFLSRHTTSVDLKKPGTASKKSSSESSSPRALSVQSKIRASISEDRSDALSSAAFSIPPHEVENINGYIFHAGIQDPGWCRKWTAVRAIMPY